MRAVALVRALNVGGRNVVSGQALQAFFRDLGFADARAVLQTGNVVFTAPAEATNLTQTIRVAFAARFGFDAAVLLRSEAALAETLACWPFSEIETERAQAADPAVEHAYVVFIPQMPEGESLRALLCEEPEGDTVRIGPEALYLLCAQSIRLSKAAIRIARAAPESTVRNLRTVRRLQEQLQQL